MEQQRDLAGEPADGAAHIEDYPKVTAAEQLGGLFSARWFRTLEKHQKAERRGRRRIAEWLCARCGTCTFLEGERASRTCRGCNGQMGWLIANGVEFPRKDTPARPAINLVLDWAHSIGSSTTWTRHKQRAPTPPRGDMMASVEQQLRGRDLPAEVNTPGSPEQHQRMQAGGAPAASAQPSTASTDREAAAAQGEKQGMGSSNRPREPQKPPPPNRDNVKKGPPKPKPAPKPKSADGAGQRSARDGGADTDEWQPVGTSPEKQSEGEGNQRSRRRRSPSSRSRSQRRRTRRASRGRRRRSSSRRTSGKHGRRARRDSKDSKSPSARTDAEAEAASQPIKQEDGDSPEQDANKQSRPRSSEAHARSRSRSRHRGASLHSRQDVKEEAQEDQKGDGSSTEANEDPLETLKQEMLHQKQVIRVLEKGLRKAEDLTRRAQAAQIKQEEKLHKAAELLVAQEEQFLKLWRERETGTEDNTPIPQAVKDWLFNNLASRTSWMWLCEQRAAYVSPTAHRAETRVYVCCLRCFLLGL